MQYFILFFMHILGQSPPGPSSSRAKPPTVEGRCLYTSLVNHFLRRSIICLSTGFLTLVYQLLSGVGTAPTCAWPSAKRPVLIWKLSAVYSHWMILLPSFTSVTSLPFLEQRQSYLTACLSLLVFFLEIKLIWQFWYNIGVSVDFFRVSSHSQTSITFSVLLI